MKKVLLILLFVFPVLAAYSEEPQKVSLSKLIDSFCRKSNFMQIEEIDKKKLDIDIEGFENDRKRKANLSLKNENGLDFNDPEIWKAKQNILKGNVYSNLSYRQFYIESVLNYSNEIKIEIDNDIIRKKYFDISFGKLTVGVKQNINDLFYSEEKYNENAFKIKDKILYWQHNSKTSVEIEKLIEDYVNIKEIELDVELKNKIKAENQETLRITKEEFEKGEKTEIETEYVQIELLKNSEEIEYLSQKLKDAKKKLFNAIGEKYSEEIGLEDLEDKKDNNILVNEYLLNSKTSEEELERETLKLIRRKNDLLLDIGAGYDVKNEQWTATVDFKMDIFNFETEKLKKLEDIRKINLEKEKIVMENEAKRKMWQTEYEHLIKSLENANTAYRVYKKKSEITKQLMIKGFASLLEYIKTTTEEKEAEINILKIINNMNGLKNKIHYTNKIQGGK